MHVLITGGAGFIGSHLAKHHLNKGDYVSIIDDLSSGSNTNLTTLIDNSKLTFHEQDIISWGGLNELIKKCDRIYHLAAVVGMFNVIGHPLETLHVNIKGTIKLFELIKEENVKPLVLIASSSEVYGNQIGLLSESSFLSIETSKKNHSAYPISKLCDESIALAYYHTYDIPCAIFRIFNTIGVNQTSQYGMVVPRLIQQAIKGEKLTVFGSGEQVRSFCDVRDTVVLMDLVASNIQCIGEIFNIGHDESITINDLTKLIKKLANSKSDIVHIPFSEIYHENYISIKERRADVSKLLALTNYQYKWMLKNSLKDLLNHAKEQTNL
jgi:nucleoside-diphosphate-sugar epimerase